LKIKYFKKKYFIKSLVFKNIFVAIFFVNCSFSRENNKYLAFK